MDLILKLIVGGVIGWLASLIMKTDSQMGLIGNIVVGIIGAGLGGWLAGTMGLGGGPVVTWLIAIGGAVILIAILKALNVFK